MIVGTPGIIMAARELVSAGGGEGCLIVMGPAEYRELTQWAERFGSTYANDAARDEDGNRLVGIPVHIDARWVGRAQILEPEAAEQYRQARRSLDNRFNPATRVET